jgi:type II secretory pathway component PulF
MDTMLFSPRISQRELAQLCRRLATALEAGLEIRSVVAREATGRASRGLLTHMSQINLAVKQGSSLRDAVQATGNYFPLLFREMVDIGEQTGHLDSVFRHLAEHYEHQLTLRRSFISAITWPVIQLVAAVCIVGLLIWVMGLIARYTNTKDKDAQQFDMLGLGLMGNSGLAIYCLIVGSVVLVGFLFFQAMRRGWFWVRPVERIVFKIPVLGKSLETLALARLAWSLHLTLDTGMDLLKALPLSLRSMRYAMYTDKIEAVTLGVRKGIPIHEALEATEVFPRDFVDSLEVGEQAGRLPESLVILSKQYQEQAQRALATLTVVAGFAVWALVAALIIMVVVRMFLFYIGMINAAAKGF